MSDLYRYNFSSEYGVEDDENGDYVLCSDYKFLQEQLEQKDKEIEWQNSELDDYSKWYSEDKDEISELKARNEKLERVAVYFYSRNKELICKYEPDYPDTEWLEMAEALNQLNNNSIGEDDE